jgi:sugar phosphate isomerase/epimerase
MRLLGKFFSVLILLFHLQVGAQVFNPSFFVFEVGLWNAESDSPDYWANLVREVGFDGMELIGLDRVDSMLPQLKKKNLTLFALYIKIEPEKPQPFDERLKDYIAKFKNTGLHLWVHVHNDKYEPSDPAGDESCVKVIKELAEFSEKYGVKIAFYPHSNFWLEKVDDGIRLAKIINKPNVGTVFNLCHFLKEDETDKLEEKIENALPHLFLVSINGADKGDTHNMDWDRLIQPLGEGTYDVLNVLQILKKNGYKNPVGLQCYNIEGKPELFLKKSMGTWKEYINQLNQ